MSMRLLIDTDPGVDDALAILMAHASSIAKVEALTITAGNVGLSHTSRNALKLLETIKAETPVFIGCGSPLVFAAEDAAFVHGEDGFGDLGYIAPIKKAEVEHAALAMIRIAKNNPQQITFLMLGPLTNLALALSLEPELPRYVKRLVIMGGAVSGRGNTRLIPAEFNIAFDPEAAAVIFERWPHFEIADWEATVRHAFALQKNQTWIEAGGAGGKFYGQIQNKTRAFMDSIGKPDVVHAADALAMAVTLHPEHVLEWAHHYVAIETKGEHTRGATIVDWDNRSNRQANAKIALRFDQIEFEKLLQRALGI